MGVPGCEPRGRPIALAALVPARDLGRRPALQGGGWRGGAGEVAGGEGELEVGRPLGPVVRVRGARRVRKRCRSGRILDCEGCGVSTSRRQTAAAVTMAFLEAAGGG